MIVWGAFRRKGGSLGAKIYLTQTVFYLKKKKWKKNNFLVKSAKQEWLMVSYLSLLFRDTPTNLVLPSETKVGKKLQRQTVNLWIIQLLVLEREHHQNQWLQVKIEEENGRYFLMVFCQQGWPSTKPKCTCKNTLEFTRQVSQLLILPQSHKINDCTRIYF